MNLGAHKNVSLSKEFQSLGFSEFYPEVFYFEVKIIMVHSCFGIPTFLCLL